MRVKQILKITDGSGGVSFTDKLRRKSFSTGFIVSIRGVSETASKRVLIAKLSTLKKSKGFYGLWLDKGTYYLDENLHLAELEAAVKLGIKHKQIAIWDCSNSESVYLEDK